MQKSPNPVDKHVGSRVRMRRLMLDLSQTRLADALGVTSAGPKVRKGREPHQREPTSAHVSHLTGADPYSSRACPAQRKDQRKRPTSLSPSISRTSWPPPAGYRSPRHSCRSNSQPCGALSFIWSKGWPTTINPTTDASTTAATSTSTHANAMIENSAIDGETRPYRRDQWPSRTTLPCRL